MSLPVELLLGVYLGILTGIIPGLVSWALGFVFRYFTGVTVPGFGVAVVALAMAGVNGGLLALTDPTVLDSASGTTAVVAIVVVTMLSLYAHAKGDAMAESFPRRLSLRDLRTRRLSADVVDLVGGHGQVAIQVTGEVRDMEGYPPLSPAVREQIRTGEWSLPADLPLSELEARFGARLRTRFDLADVSVRIDERGRATVVAAPPLSGVSRRVPQSKFAVSVRALLPSGLAPGDEVELVTDDRTVRGTVVSARCDDPSPDEAVAPDGGEEAATADAAPPRAQTTAGGDGRLTVAVGRTDATALLTAERPRVVVHSRGAHREYELVSLLRRAGKRFRTYTVRSDSALDGTTLGAADVRDTYGVAVLAVRRGDRREVAPRGDAAVSAGDELFVVGTSEALGAFREATA